MDKEGKEREGKRDEGEEKKMCGKRTAADRDHAFIQSLMLFCGTLKTHFFFLLDAF